MLLKIINKKIVLLLIIVSQVIIFWDYIPFIQWGQIKVSGLACTCPDESVLGGELYLRYITPDSLKKYNLDYSEIYVTERPYAAPDWMGTDEYLIKGEVIGKKRVCTESLRWNPLIKVNSWRPISYFEEIFLMLVLVIELIFVSLKHQPLGLQA